MVDSGQKMVYNRIIKGAKPMFSGEYAHQLDEKNRIRIPAKYKAELGDKYVCCKGATKCIYVMPVAAFEKEAEKFSAISLFDEEAQDALSELWRPSSRRKRTSRAESFFLPLSGNTRRSTRTSSRWARSTNSRSGAKKSARRRERKRLSARD